ncbi:MAG TPA: thioredoxin family protein [Chitinophagaceae bacterium]|nr:thioredoxin family protein [Chitinophagaceae bacterium]
MRIKLSLVLLTMISCSAVFSQDMAKFKLYKPEENAETSIAAAVKEAKEKGKHVFIQIGGNWCIWCARFNDFVTADLSIDSLVQKNYVVYHMNWSKENKNEELLKKYKFPQRFGFPVFLVLDAKGNLIHTQNSEYLEKEKGYDKAKVVEFFKNWSPSALDPANYKDQ